MEDFLCHHVSPPISAWDCHVCTQELRAVGHSPSSHNPTIVLDSRDYWQERALKVEREVERLRLIEVNFLAYKNFVGADYQGAIDRADKAERRIEAVCEALNRAFVSEAERGLSLERVVQHAVDHHAWHHDAQDASYVRRIEEDRDRYRTRKDGAYEERNRVVALLARIALGLGWRAGVRTHEPDPDPNWDKEWLTVVCIDLPTGQVSWHLHDSQKFLVAGLPKYEGSWDGHDTEEKYRRVEELRWALLF